jgi:hypothetical protein
LDRAPRVLYHFTSRPYWHFIKTEGITRGEVPITPEKILNWPNLTSNPDPFVQAWAGSKAAGCAMNKRAVRITVELPAQDENLMSWRELATRCGIERWWYRKLDEAGGWQAKNWWIYRGVIRPEWFSDVEFLDNDVIDEFELQLLSVFEQSANYEEAVRRMTVRAEGNVVVLDPRAFTSG